MHESEMFNFNEDDGGGGNPKPKPIKKGHFRKVLNTFNEHITATGNTITGVGGYASAVQYRSLSNSKHVYRYGTKTTTASQLSRANKVFQLRVSKFASVGGRFVAGGGALVSGYQYYDRQITGYELSADLIMTGVGVWGGPIGAGASVVYFGGKAVWNYYNPNNPVFSVPKN